MPNIATTLYVKDKDYFEKFYPRKEEIMQKMRDYIRDELGIEKTERTKTTKEKR